MGTSYAVTGKLEFPDEATVLAWLDAKLPEAPEAPYPWDSGESEHTARSLLEYWTTRDLPGEVNDASVQGTTFTLDGMINEDDWRYWASEIHALVLAAANAGASGEVLAFDVTEPEGAALIAADGALAYGSVDADDELGSLVSRLDENLD